MLCKSRLHSWLNFVILCQQEHSSMTESERTVISINSRTKAFLFFARRITPSRISPCPGRWVRTQTSSSGWRAKRFSVACRFPVLHIDTTYEFPEMLEFREWATKHHNLNLIVKINTEARARGIGLRDARSGDSDARTEDGRAATSARRIQMGRAHHRHSSRRRSHACEGEIFSPRNAQFEWDYKDQPPEFWSQFATTAAKGEHVRVQPLLDWTEVDIWRYIQREKYSDPENVFRAKRKTFSFASVAARSRIRSKATHPQSTRSSPNLKRQSTTERAGRAQDHYERNAMQKLRAKGFLMTEMPTPNAQRPTLNLQRQTLSQSCASFSSVTLIMASRRSLDAILHDTGSLAGRQDRGDKEGLRG